MHNFKNLQILFCIIGFGCSMILAVPLEGAAEGAVPAPESLAPAVPVPVAPAPAPVAPAPVAPAPANGGGSITEHKNPDGSTFTVTRFNGPLPPSAFPSNPFAVFHENAVASHIQNTALFYQNLNNFNRNFFLNPFASQQSYLNPSLLSSNWFTAFPFQFPGGLGGGWGSPYGSPFYYPWGPAANQGYQRTA